LFANALGMDSSEAKGDAGPAAAATAGRGAARA
jgi:hypothetical protein